MMTNHIIIVWAYMYLHTHINGITRMHVVESWTRRKIMGVNISFAEPMPVHNGPFQPCVCGLHARQATSVCPSPFPSPPSERFLTFTPSESAPSGQFWGIYALIGGVRVNT